MDSAEQTLADIRRLRENSRRLAQGGVWLPALLLAALVLASTALYRLPFGEPASVSSVTLDEMLQGSWSFPYWAGLPAGTRSALGAYLFWFTGLPLVVLASAAWYWRRGRRVGVKVAWPWFAGTALTVLALLAIIAAVPVREVTPRQPVEGWQGLLTPLLAVAVAAIALGVVERSRALAAGGAWVGVVAGWACVLGLGGVPGGQVTILGLDRPGPVLVLAALPLLAVALRGVWRGVRR